MNEPTRRDHKELLESLTSGKLPRNLSWSSVIDLIGNIGEVQPHGNDEFVFVVGTQRCFFKRPSGHDLAVEEVSRLRRFLKEAGDSGADVKTSGTGRAVVVIDHHVAHVYQSQDGQIEREANVRPYDPFHFHHHLIHRKEAHYKGERVPEEHSYYEEIAQDLAHAEAIILVGDGTGKSSAVEFLAEYLEAHHREEFQRIIATEIVNLSALTEGEVEEVAKRHLATVSDSD